MGYPFSKPREEGAAFSDAMAITGGIRKHGYWLPWRADMQQILLLLRLSLSSLAFGLTDRSEGEDIQRIEKGDLDIPLLDH